MTDTARYCTDLVQPIERPKTAQDHQHFGRKILFRQCAHLGKEASDAAGAVAGLVDGVHALSG